jgi:asparagine synthase (glutamine-hydrolysing)
MCHTQMSDLSDARSKRGDVLKRLDSAIYDESYVKNILLENDSYLLAYTGYRGYPIEIFENDNFWSCIEGRIYEKASSQRRDQLIDLFEWLPNSHLAEQKNKIIDWLLKTDGDFILVVLDKSTNNLFLLNDILGRLPLYYYKDNIDTIISREFQFVSAIIGKKNNKFDRMAIAQYLIFGFVLGNRTFLSNVQRIHPATLVKIKEGKIILDKLYSFNFEKKKYADDDVNKTAKNLASLFCMACENRASSNNKNIVSLSGGFDSRSVVACLHKNKIPCLAVTYAVPGWNPITGNNSEENIAEQITRRLSVDWQNLGLSNPTTEDTSLLLRTKHGSSYLGYSFIIPFLKNLREKYGSDVIFMTGDGGDVTLPCMLPSNKFHDTDGVVDYIINREGGMFTLSEVSEIVKIAESEILCGIKDIISMYPEKNLAQKFVHFTIFEAGFKCVFEIEDMNRFFFWSVSPFYSPPFFHYAMNCNDGIKSHSALQRQFLLELYPAVAAIKNADINCSIISNKYKLHHFIMSLTYKYPIFKNILRSLRNMARTNNNNGSHLDVTNRLREQLNSCESISDYLSSDKIEQILEKSDRYVGYSLEHLFTVTSLIEETYSKSKSTKK